MLWRSFLSSLTENANGFTGAWPGNRPTCSSGTRYMAGQLRAFASGDRHNEVNEQMRNVAPSMTPEEIDGVAKHYATLNLLCCNSAR